MSNSKQRLPSNPWRISRWNRLRVIGVICLSSYAYLWSRHVSRIVHMEDTSTSAHHDISLAHAPHCTVNDEGQTVCLYRDICYSIKQRIWYVPAPSEGVMGTGTLPYLTNRDPAYRSEPKWMKCDESFQPEVMSQPSTNVRTISGTTYYLCCWYNHFGHILLNMVFPTFHALAKLGLIEDLPTMNYLITDRGPRWHKMDVFQTFQFITAGNRQRVLSFENLIRRSVTQKQDAICFERLATGMLFDTLINGESPSNHIEVNMLQPLKNYLWETYQDHSPEDVSAALRETMISGQSGPKDCQISYLVRNTKLKRTIRNEDTFLKTLQSVFHEDHWNFQTIAFDDASLKSQYLTLQHTQIFLSVSGTGMHMATFLPDGAASVEVALMKNKEEIFSVNKGICQVIPTLHCFVCPPAESKYEDWDKAMFSGGVNVNVPELLRILVQVHAQWNDKCSRVANDLS